MKFEPFISSLVPHITPPQPLKAGLSFGGEKGKVCVLSLYLSDNRVIYLMKNTNENKPLSLVELSWTLFTPFPNPLPSWFLVLFLSLLLFFLKAGFSPCMDTVNLEINDLITHTNALHCSDPSAPILGDHPINFPLSPSLTLVGKIISLKPVSKTTIKKNIL